MLRTEDALKALAAEGLLVAADAELPETFTSVSTDSREVAPGLVFAALTGERHDAHHFVGDVAKKGAAFALVERRVNAPVAQVVVTSTLEAYGALAHLRRTRSAARVLAVAGSNGKTTTTQMAASILREAFGTSVVATRGNFNNAVGVPRTLFELEDATPAAVVEAGMNHPGELAALAARIAPDAVLLTNAQREHQAYLGGVRETAYENGMAIAALREGGVAVWPADDACADVWASFARARGARGYTFSSRVDRPADALVLAGEAGAVRLVLSERIPGGAREVELKLAIAGEHNAHNAAGAALAALLLGAPLEAVVRALEGFRALRGRGEVRTVGTVVVYDETYNANPDSMKAAMRILAAAKAAEKVFVLGDMAELGSESEAFHAETGEYAFEAGLRRLWCCGTKARCALEAFLERARRADTVVEGRSFASTAELEAALEELPKADAALSFKASHSTGFGPVLERYLELLGRRAS